MIAVIPICRSALKHKNLTWKTPHPKDFGLWWDRSQKYT
jgi:hypothetical protein